MATLVSKVRWQIGDRPLRSRTVNALNSTDAAGFERVVTLPSGHASRFSVGMRVEFDDDSEEATEVTAVDTSAGTVTLMRGQEMTAISAHAAATALLIAPRFSYVQVADALTDIVEGELWPDIWIPSEFTMPYEADGVYAPAVTGLEDVRWIYQAVAGDEPYIIEDFTFISAEQADAGYPNGMLLVPDYYDSSQLYIYGRLRPTTTNLTDRLLRLSAIGVSAQLSDLGEVQLVGPDASAAERRIQEGSRARAGANLWDRFERRRWREHVNLSEDELQKRPGG
jgi:hypothetical protein